MRGARDEPGIELSEIWTRIWTSRIAVIAGTVFVGVIAAVISLLIPPRYDAATQIMPTPQGGGIGAFRNLSASLADLGVDAQTNGTNPEVFAPIIHSRQLLTSLLSMPVGGSDGSASNTLIDFLDPPGTGAERIARGVETLRRAIGVDLDRRSGVVTVTVRSKNPEVAARVANAADSLVQGFLLRAASNEASARREFIEGRLSETRTLLAQREDDLRQFRQRNVRIGNSPSLQLEEARLQRSLREQEELYMTLVREFETAKIDAMKDVPTLTVVDPATTPAFRAWPKRKVIVLFGLVVGLMGMCTVAVSRPIGPVQRRA